MEMLKANQIKKSFGKLSVLKGVDLAISRGEVMAILGPSGSGKSTLLRCINTLEKVDSGSVYIEGECLFDAQSKEYFVGGKDATKRLRAKLGMVFQNFNLFPHLSVIDNITLAPTTVLNQPKDQAQQTAMDLLKKVGLEFKAKSYPFELSGGQQQRVAIARALALNPDILCFDEPTSSLDPELTLEVLNVMKSLAQEHMTMIVVTHEIGFAKEAADTVLFMDDGNILERGAAKDIIDHPSTERAQTFFSKMLKV